MIFNGFFKTLLAICVLASSPVIAQEAQHYRIIEKLNHDATLFTQGLEISGGTLYESSGLYGKSKVRKYASSGNSSIAETRLPEKYFAEGLTVFDREVYVLTWKENTALILDSTTLEKKRELSYSGEGWGLTNNGTHLMMSDGSDTVYYRDPLTFHVERKITIHSGDKSIQQINELEYAEGFLWANVWQSPVILKINPINGKVVGFYNMEDLVKAHSSGRDEKVLNGIAYDPERKAYWVTGKLWPTRYLIEFGQPLKIP